MSKLLKGQLTGVVNVIQNGKTKFDAKARQSIVLCSFVKPISRRFVGFCANSGVEWHVIISGFAGSQDMEADALKARLSLELSAESVEVSLDGDRAGHYCGCRRF